MYIHIGKRIVTKSCPSFRSKTRTVGEYLFFSGFPLRNIRRARLAQCYLITMQQPIIRTYLQKKMVTYFNLYRL